MTSVYDDQWTTILCETLKSATSLFLGGTCILLAAQACYFLSKRRSPGRGVLICAVMVACGLAIAQMVHQVVVTAMMMGLHHAAETTETASGRQRLQGSLQHLSQVKAQHDQILLLVNNLSTDSLFIYRCYVIWGVACYRRWVVGISLLLVLFTTIFGIVTSSLLWSPKISNIVVGTGMIVSNLLVTGLTAGRIWWSRRHSVGGEQLVHRYKTAIALLLESSGLYFIVMFAFFMVEIHGSPALLTSPGISILNGAGVQLMNILPALLVVWASLARSVDVDPTAGNLKLES
ncbi:hypothetical protein B0H14DRAFT_3147798 [Mycena olivaceomarginata]|nr:hypothetical protein B0H14DRAFT_3147798 [Mycena olivaceomarginata]